MKKGERIFEKENISVLNQIVKTLEESGSRLEEAYEKKDYEKFNMLKRFMLKIQKQISIILK